MNRMKSRIGGGPLLAALALVLATNLVALGGVAWNREGEPGSELTLTQRELGAPWYGYRTRENSGVSLRIDWRAPERADDDGDDAINHLRYSYLASNTRSPDWLDEAKMLALGFALPPAVDSEFPRYRARTPEREVLLVLEFDGPAYRASLAYAQHLLDKARADAAAHPAKPDLAKRAEDVQKNVAFLQEKGSRLFAVDAGLDATVLRARYPDRAHYAIVRGRVGPEIDRRKDGVHLAGYIARLSVGEIHAPAGWLPVPSGRAAARKAQSPAYETMMYEARVAWGRRLEPWIVAATPVRVVAPAAAVKTDEAVPFPVPADTDD